MGTMDFVPIELAGREILLRYTADDIQDICRRLTTFQPVGGGKVTPVMLGNLLMSLDPDAFQFCLWAGMRHIAQYKNADPADAQKLIRASIEHGAQYTDFRRPIFKAMIQCGLADFAPIVKILEDAEAQAAQDGATEADGGNGGNVLTKSEPEPSSMMRISTGPLSAAV